MEKAVWLHEITSILGCFEVIYSGVFIHSLSKAFKLIAEMHKDCMRRFETRTQRANSIIHVLLCNRPSVRLTLKGTPPPPPPRQNPAYEPGISYLYSVSFDSGLPEIQKEFNRLFSGKTVKGPKKYPL